MNRETIAEALFTLLKASAGFNTATRRWKHWADVPPTDQPALLVIQKGERVEHIKGVPAKHTLRFEVGIYVSSGDPNLVPSTLLNPLMDAVDAALSPAYGDQTLGGLVSHCRIVGDVQTDEGVLGSQAVASLPIEIVAP